MAGVSRPAARIRRQILIRGRDQQQFGDRVIRWTNAVDRLRFAGHGASGGGPDEPEQELVDAHEAGGRPGVHGRADWSVGPAVGHVRARVAKMPSTRSHRARPGTGSRCRAAYSTTIEDEYTSPSIVAGSRRAVIPLSPWARTTSEACQ